MKYLIFIFAASCLLTSCSDDFFSQTVKIDPPEYNKQLSFHLTMTNQDSVVRLLVTRNFGIIEDVPNEEDWYVKGAIAELYENGQKWLTFNPLHTDSSYILTGVLPHALQAGSSYEIRVEHPDYPKTRAVQVVPNDFQVDSVRVRYDAILGETGDRLNLLEVYIRDQGNVKNYYEVRLSGRFYNVFYTPDGMDTFGISENPIYADGYNDPNVLEGFNASGLVSDQFFDGQLYKFQARFAHDPETSLDSTIVVQVRSVTEEQFKWSRSYQLKYESDDNPFTEPISVFNNLDNGLGIFSTVQEKSYLIRK